MAINSRSTNVFTSSFMRGFSFVDDIKARQRDEQRLEERLAQQEEERAFQRRRIQQIDRDRAEDRAIRAEDRATAEARRQTLLSREEAGRAAAMELAKPEAQQNTDILIAGAADSPAVLAALQKRNLTAAQLQALKDVRGSAGTSGAASRAGAVDQGLATGAASQAAEPGQLGATEAELSQLAPSRGRDTTQAVDLDEITGRFDPDSPQGGFVQRIGQETAENFEGAGERLSGAAKGLASGAARVMQNIAGTVGVDIPQLRGSAGSGESAGDAILGDVQMPEAYTTEAEFAEITDPAAIEEAARMNEQIVEQVKQRGLDRLGGDTQASRIELLRQGSASMRAEAQRAEAAVIEKYEGFTDPQAANKVRAMALDDPTAAVATYFNDRATLRSANPQMADAMDIAMQEPIKLATAEMQGALQNTVQGTPEHAKARQRLRSLQVTQKQIYEDYSPSQQAGIDDRGLLIGNAELSGRVAELASDPNRPRPSAPQSGSAIKAAAVMTNRMAGSRRATDRQLKAGLLLVDAGLAGKQDLMVLNMTGKWPDSAPATKFITGKPGDVIFAQGTDGSLKQVAVVPGGKGTKGRKGKNDPRFTNQFGPEELDNFQRGISTVFTDGGEGTEQFMSVAEGMLLDDADWIQENFDLSDPIAMNRIGRLYAGAVALANEEDHEWIPNLVEPEHPTAREILTNPQLAARLAREHDIPMTLLPEIRMDGIAVNNMRQDLLIPNKHPAALRALAEDENMSDAEFVFSIARYDELRRRGQQ